MKDLFTVYGKIGRRTYFILLIKLLALSILATVIYIILMLIGSSLFPETSSTIFPIYFNIITIMFLLFNLASYVISVLLVLRRARDLDYTVLWVIVGVLVPLGFILVGIIPAKKSLPHI